MARYDLKGKTVVITGASSGIGAACGVLFAKRGATVVLSGRNLDMLKDAEQQVQAAGGQAFVAPADVTKKEEVDSLVRNAIEKTGRIDVMFIGAGFGVFGRIENITMDLWRRQMDTNFYGALYCFYAALPHLMKQKSGQFIFMNSGSGRFALPLFAPYCASKFALPALADSARYDLRPYNIDVLSVYPAFVVTKFHGSIVSPDFEVSGEMAAKSGGITAEAAAEAIVSYSEKRKKELIFSAGGKFAAVSQPKTLPTSSVATLKNP